MTELTSDEIQRGADALSRALGLQNDHTGETIATLRKLLNERIPGCEKNLLALEHNDPDTEREMLDEELPHFAVSLFGIEFFEGKSGKKIRDFILAKMFERNPHSVIGLLPPNRNNLEWAEQLDLITKQPWKPGGSLAREFVRIIGFPSKFAGMASEKKPENVEGVERRTPLGDLLVFQVNLKAQVVFLLMKNNGMENRGILRLPTGSGKTRIAVDAIIEFWKKRAEGIRFVLWIAQTEELCEQAFQSFKQVWEEHGTEGEILNLYRVWGKRGLPDAVDEGIIVAGISQLNSLISTSGTGNDEEKDDELSRIKDVIGAVIVDEAHRSTTAMYSNVFDSLVMSSGPDDSEQIPLLGITATPYRSGDYQTEFLLKKYNNNVLSPDRKFDPKDNFDDRWRDYDFVLDKLTRDEVLSVPAYYYPFSGSDFSMDKKETQVLESQHIFPDALLVRVGEKPSRNLVVYNIIKKWADKGRNILFFGANVNQAVMMKEFLNRNGIKSAVITGETKYGSRHKYVKMFREKSIQVLCNYNVLTTGFDSPKVDTVIIARPTGSRLMYEQMVGRGLRGPKFGGTKSCVIITVLDNILNYHHRRIRQGHEEFADSIKNGISKEERTNLEKVREEYAENAELSVPAIPVEGEIFTNSEIQKRFRVKNSGGIRFTRKHNLVVLIDSDMSNYENHVDEELGTITYTGTGEGDQGFDWGIDRFNARVRKPASTLMFFKKRKNQIVFKYLVKYESHSFDTEKNRAGRGRRVIKFQLKIIKKSCPNCNDVIASNDQEIEKYFGYRTSNGKAIPQSWCRECRSI